MSNPIGTEKKELPKIVSYFKSLWNVSQKSTENSSGNINCKKENLANRFYRFYGFNVIDVFNILEKKYANMNLVLNEIKEIYTSLTLLETSKVLIHGDPSCHEFIFDINGHIWWIDWESYEISDAYIDIACFYYSCCHFFHNNIKLDYLISNRILEEFNVKLIDNFSIYFIERLISTANLSGKSFNFKIFEWALNRLKLLQSGAL